MNKTLLICILLFLINSCSSLIYYPTTIKYSSPKNFGLQFEEVEIITKDKTKIYAWYIRSTAKKRKGLILQFHGNAQNMSAHYLSLAWLTKEGYDVFTFDYRGYGISDGSPGQLGLRDDGTSTIEFVINHYLKDSSDKFIVYGQSLGGIVSLILL